MTELGNILSIRLSDDMTKDLDKLLRRLNRGKRKVRLPRSMVLREALGRGIVVLNKELDRKAKRNAKG